MDSKISLTSGIGLGKGCTKAFFTPLTLQDLKANLWIDEQGFEEFSWFSAALSQAQSNDSKAEKVLPVQVSWGGKAPGLGDQRSQALKVTLKLSKTDADLNYCWIRKVKKYTVCVWLTKDCDICGLKRSVEEIALILLEMPLRKNA